MNTAQELQLTLLVSNHLLRVGDYPNRADQSVGLRLAATLEALVARDVGGHLDQSVL